MNQDYNQSLLFKNVILEDVSKKAIGAVSHISYEEGIASCFVVCSYPEFEILEKQFTKLKTSFPYIPGKLVFREGPAVLIGYKKLKTKPDLIMLKAAGICHPDFFGMASHIGMLLNKPTIGITKKLLCGNVKGDKIIYNNSHVGWKLKNIYISPGYKISLRDSLKFVKSCMKGHRLPEPLYVAEKLNKIYFYNKKD